MRCPKCHYISFDAGERCRNCGYEFSLSVAVEDLDLPIQTGREPEGPLDDFHFGDTPPRVEPAQPPAAAVPPSRPRDTGFELPLFNDRPIDDDRPLVTPPAVPRAPLSVRKASPVVARAPQRARVEEPELDLSIPEPRTPPPVSQPVAEPASLTDGIVPASLGRRLGAGLIDMIILAALDLAVLYFTMQLCGLRLDEITMIPVAPFAGYLLLQNGGYVVTFVAAGGQSIGKMAFNIKVVPIGAEDGWSDRVRLGTAVLRTVVWFLTVLPAGVGLLPALFGAERRTLHDRLAGTRVVKV